MTTRAASIAACLAMAACATPGTAQQDATDWWLIYGQDDAATSAQFVDLAAIDRTANGATVTILTVDPAGRTAQRALTITCTDGQAARSVPAFVCGTDAYRAHSGLNIRDFPPVALAKIYFETRAKG